MFKWVVKITESNVYKKKTFILYLAGMFFFVAVLFFSAQFLVEQVFWVFFGFFLIVLGVGLFIEWLRRKIKLRWLYEREEFFRKQKPPAPEKDQSRD